jgi:hypothetical protein
MDWSMAKSSLNPGAWIACRQTVQISRGLRDHLGNVGQGSTIRSRIRQRGAPLPPELANPLRDREVLVSHGRGPKFQAPL